MALDQRVRRRLEVALSVSVQLDACKGTEVGTDNLRHVGIILLKAGISSVPGDTADGAGVDFDVGIS